MNSDIMKLGRTVICAVAILGLFACGKKKDDEDGKQTSAASASAPAPTVSAAAPEPKDEKPTIEPRVKAEVDGRADGIPGTPTGAAGAGATVQAPKGWAPTKGELTVYAPADKKAQLAVGAFTPAEGPTAKLAAAATALGLTACEWGNAEPVTVGHGKLASTAADGVCKRGTAVVRTAFVAPIAEKLLVVGAWDGDGDAAAVFGAMRTIAKPPAGDSSGIAACCAALRQNARSAPPDQAPYLVMAANMCDSLRRSPQGRQTLAQIRAGLRGAHAPSACR